MTRPDRRTFLRHASAMTAAMGGTGMWLSNLAAVNEASAQSSGADYRALVCVFLNGGNDSHNTVIPTDDTSWYCYQATRDPKFLAAEHGVPVPEGAVTLALPKSSLLAIRNLDRQAVNAGRTFALHPELKRIQQLYGSGSAAIVANVGALTQPTGKLNLTDPTFELPRKLRSHNDQTSTWQSFGPEGVTGGWGGLIMDRLVARNGNQHLGSIGVGSNAVWLNGRNVLPYLMASNGFHVMGGKSRALFGDATAYQAARAVASSTRAGSMLMKDYARVAKSALNSESTLVQAVPESQVAPWGTPGATGASDPLLQYKDPISGKTLPNSLAQQLQTVARMIAARNHATMGMRRQVFMVSLGGFDTHSNQLLQHPRLLAQLDHAIGYFQNCLATMPGGDMRSQVTTFTASEFGRSLVNNGDGTDHGWGGHHFVIGGAVRGGEIYGHFPDFLAFDGNGNFFSDQMLPGGVLLPELSIDHLVYTLGRWMGVAEADLLGSAPGTGICPNIGNFPTSGRDIGFMV